jgi:hypothetical protein
MIGMIDRGRPIEHMRIEGQYCIWPRLPNDTRNRNPQIKRWLKLRITPPQKRHRCNTQYGCRCHLFSPPLCRKRNLILLGITAAARSIGDNQVMNLASLIAPRR